MGVRTRCTGKPLKNKSNNARQDIGSKYTYYQCHQQTYEQKNIAVPRLRRVSSVNKKRNVEVKLYAEAIGKHP